MSFQFTVDAASLRDGLFNQLFMFKKPPGSSLARPLLSSVTNPGETKWANRPGTDGRLSGSPASIFGGNDGIQINAQRAHGSERLHVCNKCGGRLGVRQRQF